MQDIHQSQTNPLQEGKFTTPFEITDLRNRRFHSKLRLLEQSSPHSTNANSMSTTYEQLNSLTELLGRPRSHSRPLENENKNSDRRGSLAASLSGSTDIKTFRDIKREAGRSQFTRTISLRSHSQTSSSTSDNVLKDESAIQEEETERESNVKRKANGVIEEQEFEFEKPLLPENLSAQPTERVLREAETELPEPYRGRRDSNEARECKLVLEQHPINPNLMPESDKSLDETPINAQKITVVPAALERQLSAGSPDNSFKREITPKGGNLLSPSGSEWNKQLDKKFDLERKRGPGAITVSKASSENSSNHLTPKKPALGVTTTDGYNDLRSLISPKEEQSKRESKNPLKKMLFNRLEKSTKDDAKKVKQTVPTASKTSSHTLSTSAQANSTKSSIKASNIEHSALAKKTTQKTPLRSTVKHSESTNSVRPGSTKAKPPAINLSVQSLPKENADSFAKSVEKAESGALISQRSLREKSSNQSPHANNTATSFLSASRRTNLAIMSTTPRGMSTGQTRSQSAFDKGTIGTPSKSPNDRYGKSTAPQPNASLSVEPGLFEIAETDRVDESELVVDKKLQVKAAHTDNTHLTKTPNKNKVISAANSRPVTANSKNYTPIKSSASQQLKRSLNTLALSKSTNADPKSFSNLSSKKDSKNLSIASKASPQNLNLTKPSLLKQESNPNSAVATPRRSTVRADFSKAHAESIKEPLSSKNSTAFSFPQQSETQETMSNAVSNKIKIFEIMSKACEA